ncbi:protein kinase [Streptomyces sp. NPDC102467]|uniref:serine/threonine-protein kinase n=1 Tax=Streptomyces sp. NPDC102467 TaxID=3366179 RepID=UPI0037FDB37B
MDTSLTADGPFEPAEMLPGAPVAIGDVLDGRWSVAELRRGGQAWVLIVDDLEQGGRRALKIPLTGALTGDAELAMLLDLAPHPHTVTALDVTRVRDRSGIVLEYVPRTLAELLPELRADGPPVPDRLATILQQICAGMGHLSRTTEVAHLDLKPSNVLIDSAGTAKIADFGLAQQVRTRDGRFSVARGGTWAYAAPEVLRQETCDARADIFSFGILLYEACTGRLPYPFALAHEPAAQHVQLLDYYASSSPRDRAKELYYWGQSGPTEVPVTPPTEGISLVVSNCLGVFHEDRPQSFERLSTLLARGLRRPPVTSAELPLPSVEQQRRVIVLAQVLVRLGRFDEAVSRLNRLLARPLPAELSSDAIQTARQALTGAGRHAEAAALDEGR